MVRLLGLTSKPSAELIFLELTACLVCHGEDKHLAPASNRSFNPIINNHGKILIHGQRDEQHVYPDEYIIAWNEMKWMVFLATILHCKAILGRGQPGRMRWILLWIMPLVQDRCHCLMLLITVQRRSAVLWPKFTGCKAYHMYYLKDKVNLGPILLLKCLLNEMIGVLGHDNAQ